jgi:hypothetical protein
MSDKRITLSILNMNGRQGRILCNKKPKRDSQQISENKKLIKGTVYKKSCSVDSSFMGFLLDKK